MRPDEKIKALISVLGPIRLDRSVRGELVFDCPRCKYRRPLLCVNFLDDRFNCWFCRFSSHGNGLARIFALGPDRKLHLEYLAYRDVHRVRATEEGYTGTLALPVGFRFPACEVQTDLGRLAASYLAARGVTEEQQLMWKIGVSSIGPYAGRLTFPSFDAAGNLNFIVSRTLDGTGVRYTHESVSRDIVFNEHLVDWRRPITLVEGPFDALAAGPNAIPLLGTVLTGGSLLHRRLIENTPLVYVALDSDAVRQRLWLCESLARSKLSVRLVDLGQEKDPASMGASAFALAKQNAEPFEVDLSLIKHRLRQLTHGTCG